MQRESGSAHAQPSAVRGRAWLLLAPAAVAAALTGCPGPATPTGPPVFSRTTAPVPQGDVCGCLALPGEPTITQAVARIPVASAPVTPPAIASRDRAIGWMQSQRPELTRPLAAIDRALLAARITRDAIVVQSLSTQRTELAALLQGFDSRIQQLRAARPASTQLIAQELSITQMLVQRARSTAGQARNAVAVDCWCEDWSPRGSHVRFAQVLIAHRPRRRDVHSVVFVVDGREVLRTAGTADSAMGTVSPGAHRLEAITTLQSGRKLTTRGTFQAGPPWELAIEHRLSAEGSRFSRQRPVH